ncbi:MAG: protein translocase subunit SecF [Deltaproteobacteria bacterium]|nr:protein translocase subunit SecF [Deltaproteobacteria bacterium]
MATHKPFRELIPDGTNFEFVGKTRTWVTFSILLLAASIAVLFVNKSMRGDYLNWTIDFKGGTEMVFAFKKKGTDEYSKIGPGEARKALSTAGFKSFDVSEFSFGTDTVEKVEGLLVRTLDFGALSQKKQEQFAQEFVGQFKGEGELKATWSGDQMFVRGTVFVSEEQAKDFFTKRNLELRGWSKEQREQYSAAEEGTGEYSLQFAIRGIDRQYQEAIAKAVGSVDVEVINVYGVGAKAGAKLRNDGIKALFYAMALIMLYLAFRFDIRYAPGAVAALLHDAILVLGVFAATWQEVSLTTVAALLTVIGYSVNDSVVIFDRIRENVDRLKDKKFSRVINISLNETLSRTILTSLTLFVVTVMMNIFGTGLVRNFAFAMNVGVVVGVYSSIFIASPVALKIHDKYFSGSSK